jgi:hypothetical protein
MAPPSKAARPEHRNNFFSDNEIATGGLDCLLDFWIICVNRSAIEHDPPKRVGVTEFESLDKAQAWINSPERKALAPQREKAVKFVRQYIVEGK